MTCKPILRLLIEYTSEQYLQGIWWLTVWKEGAGPSYEKQINAMLLYKKYDFGCTI